MDIEEAYLVAGSIGSYQVLVVLTLALASIPAALQTCLLVYAGEIPSQANCIINDSVSRSLVATKHCTAAGCDSISYSTDLGFTSIATEWDLICEKDYLSGAAISVYMLGTMFGSIICGWFSDTYGRRVTFYSSLLIFTAAAFASSFASAYSSFTAFRFIVGFAGGGIGIAGYVLCSESVGSKWRAAAGNSVNVCFSIGLPALAGLAYLYRDWRHLTLAAAFPGLVLLASVWYVPESPRWLSSRDRQPEAEVVLNRYAAWAGEPGLHVKLSKNKNTRTSISPLIFLRHRTLRLRIVVAAFRWTVCALVYYGITLNIKSIPGDKYVSFILLGLVELPAVFLPPVLDRCGRRTPLITTFVLSGLSCLAFPFVPNIVHRDIVITCLALIGKLAITCAFNIVFIYDSELFPTALRSQALGACSTVSRVGSMVSPFAVTLGVWYGAPAPYLLFASLAIAAATISLLLPDTLGCKIPDTVGELDAMDGDVRNGVAYSKVNEGEWDVGKLK